MIYFQSWTSLFCLWCCVVLALAQEQARIDYMTAHQEVAEGEAVHLQCLVTLAHKPDNVDVIWQRRIIASTGNVAQEKLSRNGKVELGDSRVSSTVRQHRVGDRHQFEYGLLIKDLQKSADEGMYDCQVANKNGTLITAKHSLVAILPQHSGPVIRSEHLERSSASITLEDDELNYGDEFESSLDEKQKVGDEKNPRRLLGMEELGPVTKRFVIVRRGMDVVLECHDAVGNEDVLWEKQGEISTVGRGKELRLFRVDRWDSGQYFCSTNTTRKSKHSVTLRVDTKPSVSAPGKQLDKKDGELKATNFAYTNLDVTAVLRCRVEATPVPQITWYMEVPDPLSLPSPISEHRTREKDDGSNPDRAKQTKKFRMLHSGEEFGISIDSYKDGVIETSLHIRRVDKRHLSNYLCQAKNPLGEDQQMTTLLETPPSPSAAATLRSLMSIYIGFPILMLLLWNQL